MMTNIYDFLFKLVLTGDSDVGKTQIRARFIEDSFDSSFTPSIGTGARTFF